MAFSAEDVRRVAGLARLHLNDDEVERMRGELDAIVAYVDQLSTVDTDGVEAVAHITGASNVTRADEPGALFSPAEALANAPQADENCFLVPKAVER